MFFLTRVSLSFSFHTTGSSFSMPWFLTVEISCDFHSMTSIYFAMKFFWHHVHSKVFLGSAFLALKYLSPFASHYLFLNGAIGLQLHICEFWMIRCVSMLFRTSYICCFESWNSFDMLLKKGSMYLCIGQGSSIKFLSCELISRSSFGEDIATYLEWADLRWFQIFLRFFFFTLENFRYILVI